MMWANLERAGRILASYPMDALNYEFPPLYHFTGTATATICLDDEANLKEIIIHDKPQPIVYPVTEQSCKRTICPEQSPHALCEQLGFMGDSYTEQVSWWADFVEKRHGMEEAHFLWTVNAYVTAGTLYEDVTSLGGDDKTMIRWKVGERECWNDERLMELWREYYDDLLRKTQPVGVDHITGKIDTIKDPRTFPKALLPGHGNGKFISAGDKTEFTWRGNYVIPQEAVTVTVESSHYAHQALKYLARHNGFDIGNNDTLMIWAPDDPTAKLTPNLWYSNPDNPLPFAWSDGFIENFRDHINIPDHLRNAPLVTMICGGATTGRNSTKYYEEGNASLYLDRIARWRYKTGWEIHTKDTAEPQPFFPSVNGMIDMAFGSMMKNKRTASDGVRVAWTNRLMLAMLQDKPLPEQLVKALVARCLTAGIYEYMIWPVTLACLRKHYADETGEVFDPMINNNTDRNYLFGRFLAWYEAFERASFNPGETRLTTAERLRTSYAKAPLEAAAKLADKSRFWQRKMVRYNRGLCSWYVKNIQELWNMIQHESDQELEPSFLFGYYAQKKDIYTKRENRNN